MYITLPLQDRQKGNQMCGGGLPDPIPPRQRVIALQPRSSFRGGRGNLLCVISRQAGGGFG